MALSRAPLLWGLGTVLASVCPYETLAANERCDNPVATVVSIQGTAQVGSAPAQLLDEICAEQITKIGTRSRAAIRLRDTDVLVRIDQNTQVKVQAISENRSVLEIIKQGVIYLFSREPKSLEVKTPYINAAVEGTEFVVRAKPEEAEVIVIEGQLSASNDFGDEPLPLVRGDSAFAQPGQAPAKRRREDVDPLAAVQWALHYPPIGAAESVSPRVRQAAELLAVGRVDEGSAVLDAVLESEPGASEALALKAIIAVAQNRGNLANTLAAEAVASEPGSSVAHTALSYARQANLDIEGALQSAQRAVHNGTATADAWARLAELYSAVGDVRASRRAADRATAKNPDLSRTQTVLGFAALASVDLEQAKAAFDKAIKWDQSDPMPRLGMGLAHIRGGALAEGRSHLVNAVSLDRNNSLLRSYLGKAYHDETFFDKKRDVLAEREFAEAKRLDDRDPTPWFYDAIRKQSLNRPVEALQDMQESIARNDNRAVYRSSLLLDQDLAARSSSLGRIYRDLGFEQLGLVEGWKSVNTDTSNFSAHRLLADSYASRPRHEIARVSELLQSQLLQPLNVTPIQPLLGETNLAILSAAGPAAPAFNEFNSLFMRNQFRLQADGVIGDNDTQGGQIVQSGIQNRFSYSVGAFAYETDGYRDNNDQDLGVYNAFLQMMIDPRTSIQAELRKTDFDRGDLELTFMDDFSPDLRQTEEFESARLGFRHSFSPGNTLLASYLHRNGDLGADVVPGFFSLDGDITGDVGEVTQLFDFSRHALTIGAGRRVKDSETTVTFGGFPTVEDTDSELTNVYAYGYLDLSDTLQLTVGGSGDFFDESFDALDKDQFNPKLGMMWDAAPKTTLRAAAFRTLQGPIVSRQTIDATLEPTHVAGFNQRFFGGEGDIADNYGVAVDHAFSGSIFGGAELVARNLDVPFVDLSSGSPEVVRRDWEERWARAYLYWTYTSRFAFSAEYLLEDFERDIEGGFSDVEEFAELRTHRLPLSVRFFDPSGLSAGLTATYVDQDGDFVVSDESGFSLTPGDDSFWVVDALLQYRLPKRRGLLTLDVANLFDEDFRFQDTDPSNPRIRPERTVSLKVSLSF